MPHAPESSAVEPGMGSPEWRARCEVNWGLPGLKSADWAFHPQRLVGALGVFQLKRLLDGLPEQPVVRHPVDARADGIDRSNVVHGVVWYQFDVQCGVGRPPLLSLSVCSRLELVCQRCLQPLSFDVDERAVFEVRRAEKGRAIPGPVDEDDSAFDPSQPEELVVDGDLDLTGLVEDQLILAVPYVPRHPVCESALPTQPALETAGRKSAFEVLSKLKRRT